MQIEIHPKKVLQVLCFIISILLLSNIVGLISTYVFDHDYVFGLVPMFDFNTEANLPTLYSSITTLCCSLLLLMIALSKRGRGFECFYWYGLAVIFLFLAIDEAVAIHEKLMPIFRQALNTTGLLYYAWVVPYGMGLTIIGAVYVRFLMKLPKNTKALFIFAGILFVSGALGFEMLEGAYGEAVGVKNITFAALYTCEELLEMLGIAVFFYALVSYFTCYISELIILFKPKA